jgi:hypothetical protein
VLLTKRLLRANKDGIRVFYGPAWVGSPQRKRGKGEAVDGKAGPYFASMSQRNIELVRNDPDAVPPRGLDAALDALAGCVGLAPALRSLP